MSHYVYEVRVTAPAPLDDDLAEVEERQDIPGRYNAEVVGQINERPSSSLDNPLGERS